MAYNQGYPMQSSFTLEPLEPQKPPKDPFHPLCLSKLCCETHHEFRAHPAHKFFVIALLFTGLATLFGFITLFVPWAEKDIAVGTRAYAALFRTTVVSTFSQINEEQVIDNDFIKAAAGAAPLTGGDSQCKALILNTIAFVFMYFILGMFLMLLLAWIILSLWRYPFMPALAALCLVIFVCIFTIIAWATWIGYAERTCLANSVYFPMKGYSYGFIMTVFATFFALVATLATALGIKKIQQVKKGVVKPKKGEVVPQPYLAPLPMTMMHPATSFVTPAYAYPPATTTFLPTPGSPFY